MSPTAEPSRSAMRGRALLTLAWLLAPALLLALMGNSELGAIAPVVLRSLLSVVVLWLACLPLPPLWFLLAAPFAACAPLELMYIAQYRQPPGYEIFASLLETNPHEAVELLGPGMAVALPLVALGSGALVLYWAWRALRLRQRSPRWTWVIAVPALIFAALELNHVRSVLAYNYADQATQWQRRAVFIPPAVDEASRSFPLGIVLRLINVAHESARLARLREVSAAFRFQSRQDPVAAQTAQLHVLVLGETARADHWQLNGYPLPTTPRLLAREQLINLPDFISHWNITRRALPVFLTRRDPRDRSDAFVEPSVVTAFAEAGFTTAWISNQRAVGEHDSVIGMYAHEAAQTLFLDLGHWRQGGKFDVALLRPFKRILRQHRDKDLFVVVHLMGSHYNYSLRVPDSFTDFGEPGPRLRDSANLDPAQAQAVTHAYDRTIAYTDWVLDQIIHEVEADGRAATVLHASDHGEDLVSESCALANHGNPTPANFHVPAVIWYSAAYAEKFPQRVSTVTAHARQPLAASIVTPTLLGLAGISTVGADPRLDLSDPAFSAPVRWVNTPEPLDFDRARRVGACQRLAPQ